MLSKEKYQAYKEILKQEIIPATGCTEPISIAYAAAIVRDQLGHLPEKMRVALSPNIIKNVKSVVVPCTGGARGIGAAVAAGICAGHSEKKLEVLSVLTEADKKSIEEFLRCCKLELAVAENEHVFDIQIDAQAGNEVTSVRIVDFHTNVVKIEKNGKKLLYLPVGQPCSQEAADNRSLLNVKDIVEFADTVKLEDIQDSLERQITCNMAIANEGLAKPYGACIGSILLNTGEQSIRLKARAYAAAGSDARMNGCEMPVCIVSGSGNQGITASVPVIVYAEELNIEREKLLRALVVSNLVTIHQKTGIGRLSAYCGVISAGCGCGAGIAYLQGGAYREIAHTVVNAVAILSGTICDGAKSSCAAKISMAVEAGIIGYEMYRNGRQFYDGEGIVRKGVERTIKNVGRLAQKGMRQTDTEIMKMMTED